MFRLLSTERQFGMGVGPIPIRAIWDWMDRAGIGDPILRRFVETILMSVDARVCGRQRAAEEAKRPPSKATDAPKEPRKPRPIRGANRPPAPAKGR